MGMFYINHDKDAHMFINNDRQPHSRNNFVSYLFHLWACLMELSLSQKILSWWDPIIKHDKDDKLFFS